MTADEFAVPVGTGMRRVPRYETDNADLRERLAEYDAVRNRGAVEIRFR